MKAISIVWLTFWLKQINIAIISNQKLSKTDAQNIAIIEQIVKLGNEYNLNDWIETQ